MSRTRVELSFAEGQRLRDLLLGEAERELRLVALLRNGFLVQAVRSDIGPVFDLPGRMRITGPRDLRVLEAAKGVERIVTIEATSLPPERLDQFWQGVRDSSIQSDPPWIPAMELFFRLSRRLRDWLAWFLQDGAYALWIEPDQDEKGRLLCARIRDGRVRALVGAKAFGVEDNEIAAESLALMLRRQGVSPRLILAGSFEALHRVVRSSTPATALEHARMRNEIRTLLVAPQLSLGLFLLRVAGL